MVMQTTDRNSQWKNVWERKGQTAAQHLHHMNGYDLLSADQWDELVRTVARPFGLQAGDEVIECGCGAGAFLASLIRLYPGIRLSGIDYSASLVRAASEALDGRFEQGDIRDLSFLPAAAYDCVLSFSAFQYLSSSEDAERAVREMARLVKPGGSMAIGDVSDLAKKQEALEIRKHSHRNQPKLSSDDLDHLYLPKGLFERLASELQLNVTIIDQATLNMPSYEAARYRFTAYFKGNQA